MPKALKSSTICSFSAVVINCPSINLLILVLALEMLSFCSAEAICSALFSLTLDVASSCNSTSPIKASPCAPILSSITCCAILCFSFNIPSFLICARTKACDLLLSSSGVRDTPKISACLAILALASANSFS